MLHHRLVPERGTVDVGLVGEVEQVVADELIAALHIGGAAAGRPFGMIHALEDRGNRRRFGLGGIARPHPQPAVPLHQRIGAHPRPRRNAGLAGDFRAFAAAVEAQPVIAAAHRAVFEPALAQRHLAVAAAVFQRHRLAVLVAEQHHRLIADDARQDRFAFDLARPRGDVPGVEDEWHRRLPRCPERLGRGFRACQSEKCIRT